MEYNDVHVLKKGVKLNQRYVVQNVLGEGGFGITYSGWDELLDVKVAIKEYYPQGFVSRNIKYSEQLAVTQTKYGNIFQQGKIKFLNEARILAKFNGEDGIVSVTDFFEENNTVYIVMEFLDGITLKKYVDDNGVLSASEVTELMIPVMESLDAIHSSGLIHRDISPDNIMILTNGKVKLMDFGAARDYTEFGQKSMSIVLKHGYAPEEQYRTHGIQGPWTDIYALSATIYKCITGVTPVESIQRVIDDSLLPPSAMGITISPQLEFALMRGLAVHQKDRYQNLRDYCNDMYSTDGRTFHAEYAGAYRQRESWTQEKHVTIPAQGREQKTYYNSNYTGNAVSNSSGSNSGDRGTMIALSVVSVVLVIAGLTIFLVFGLKNKTELSSKNEGETKIQEVTESMRGTTEMTTEAPVEQTTAQDTTQAEVEPQEVPALPYTDNAIMDIDACLSPSSYEVVTSNDGTFSFGYPKYLFNQCYVDYDNNYYELTYENGESVPVKLFVYVEENNPGDPLKNSDKLYDRFASSQMGNYYKWISKKTDNMGMARAIIGGYMNISGSESRYVIAANDGERNYILEFYYPDPNPEYEFDGINYIVDCIYRYCSFGGTTYKPREFNQFFDDKSMGEKK